MHPSPPQSLPSPEAIYAQTYQGARGRQLGGNNGPLSLAANDDPSASLLGSSLGDRAKEEDSTEKKYRRSPMPFAAENEAGDGHMDGEDDLDVDDYD